MIPLPLSEREYKWVPRSETLGCPVIPVKTGIQRRR